METLKCSYTSSKSKRNPPKKISNSSGNRNPEKISYLLSKENSSYILGNRNPKENSLYFR